MGVNLGHPTQTWSVAEDLVATVDLPEFASSAMDGFAVRASDVSTATPASPVELKIVGRALSLF